MIGNGIVRKAEIVSIRSANDVVVVRQRVRALTVELKFSLVDQTKIVTAASELGRNTLEHGLGGEVELAVLSDNGREGLRMTFSDAGPGIPDLAQAMQDGFSTGKGMGLGLGGSKRLMHEFNLRSDPGSGTVATVVRWR